MLRRIKKIIISISLLFLLVLGQFEQVYAAHFNVTARNNKNGTVTVTASGQVVGGLSVSVGGKSGTLAIRTLGGSDSVTLKTGAGTFTVTVTAISLSDANYNVIEGETVKKSVTVTNGSSSTGGSSGTTTGGSNETTGGTSNNSQPSEPVVDNRSKENSLSSLSVSKGQLSPNFKSTTTSYSVNVSGDINKIIISAKAKDSKARISGTGEKNLKVGKNIFKVKCTAENGSSKTYTIAVNVDETPTVFTNYNGEKLGVVRNLDGVNGPNKTFERTKVTLEGQEVTAWNSTQMNKTVVYLVDDNNEKKFYLYKDGKIISSFDSVSFGGINLFVVDISKDEQNIPGLKFSDLKIDNQNIPGWIFENKNLNDYEVIYAMKENGEMTYYLHEKSENSFTLFSEEFMKMPTQIAELEDEKNCNIFMRNVFIGTTVVASVVAIAGFVMYFNFKKKSISAIKEYYEKKNQG